MFSRESQTKKLAVEIVCLDGAVLRGHLLVPMTSDLVRTINNDIRFLHFESYEGASRFIAKAAIAQIASLDMPRAQPLRTPAAGDQDPYAILGLQPGAPWAEVRAAYLRMTKRYHPDQFESVALPDEVVKYLAVMFARSNAAYTAIRDAIEAARTEKQPSEPSA